MNSVSLDASVSRGALWFGLLGGAAAWTTHLILAYVIAEFGCVGGLAERSYLGVSHVAWLELVLSLVMIAASGLATAVAYRSDRRLSGNSSDLDEGRAAVRHTARTGLITSGIFTFVIVFESIPIFYYLRHC